MHKQYVEYMRGIDVTDHLRGNYSCQLKCHKWWMKIFHLVVDQTIVNSYVTWTREMEELGLKIMPHLLFKIALGKHLVLDALEARQRRAGPQMRLPRRPPPTQGQSSSKLKRQCIVCGHPQRSYCAACGYRWMCKGTCYFAHHEILNENLHS
jgi:hypothetical protein